MTVPKLLIDFILQLFTGIIMIIAFVPSLSVSSVLALSLTGIFLVIIGMGLIFDAFRILLRGMYGRK